MNFHYQKKPRKKKSIVKLFLSIIFFHFLSFSIRHPQQKRDTKTLKRIFHSRCQHKKLLEFYQEHRLLDAVVAIIHAFTYLHQIFFMFQADGVES